MTMTSFNFEVDDYGDSMHVSVRIFAGPDPSHRALTGIVTMLKEEAEDFQTLHGALEVVREAERAAAYCPSCGCDWDSELDAHDSGCRYVAMGGKRGAR
jgi:hypothetical protein